ncbi:hypothetical protein ACFY7C_20340 [Streptomyces sp. NPDC012769]|uniref:hypothetical protein n=1 Tax=Streptomyces sp. NPDC012769 TaxID=3364848 RepID=UPI0036A39332
MSRELVREVESLLVEAGFGPGSGLTTHSHGDAVIVSWHADRLIRPTISVHATDPGLHAAAEINGIRTALGLALTSVLGDAGLTAVMRPDGFVVTREAPAAQGGGG